MPLLPISPQLARPALRPLVAQRLTPPKDPKTGAAFEGTPVETPSGLIWTMSFRSWTPKGVVPFLVPNGQAVWANLTRRWWSYGVGGGAGLLDAATGTTRVFHRVQSPVDDLGTDDHGVPVGLIDDPNVAYSRPCHGETALRLPPGYIDSPLMYSTVLAAPKGPTMAGALTVKDRESPDLLPFVWADDRAEPRALPMPEGYRQAAVSALNSRGDVTGLIAAPDLPSRAVVWPAKGGITFIPVGSRHSDDRIADEAAPKRWSASGPFLLTEDGIVIGREHARDRVYGHITTYWDGARTIWLPDAIEGVRAIEFGNPIRLAADGRSLLLKINDGRTWGWYRVSPR